MANRLPVDRVTDADGNESWQQSPGGLVTAMQSVMTGGDGAWVGWSGDPGDAPEPFDADGLHLHAVGLTRQEVEDHYEGMSNDTLWPLYHDVIVPPRFRRRWFDGYRAVNRRFAQAAARLAAPGATVWVHDYQLQLVPAMLRRAAARRADRLVQPHPVPAGRAVRPAAVAARDRRGPARI